MHAGDDRRHLEGVDPPGGNFAVALPDPEQSFPAMKALELSVHIGTKLNRSHLLVAKQTLILPCPGAPSWICRPADGNR